MEECGPCPVFASFTLAFALQLRKKRGITSVIGKKNLSQVKSNLNQGTVYILPKIPTHYKTLTNTHMKSLNKDLVVFCVNVYVGLSILFYETRL